MNAYSMKADEQLTALVAALIQDPETRLDNGALVREAMILARKINRAAAKLAAAPHGRRKPKATPVPGFSLRAHAPQGGEGGGSGRLSDIYFGNNGD